MNRGTRKYLPARSFLLENWVTMSDRELAYETDLTMTQIREMRRRMGLLRSEDNQRVMRDKNYNKRGWSRVYRLRERKT